MKVEMKAAIFGAALLWLGLGLYATGTANAYFRGKYCDAHRSPSWAATEGAAQYAYVVGGPMSAFVTMMMSSFNHYGWTLSRQPTEKCEKRA